MRFFGIEDWIVEVERRDGSVQKISAWAGGHSSPYDVDSLMHSLEEKTGEPYFHEYMHARLEGRAPNIEGIEKAYLAIENKHVNVTTGVITIGVQNQNQSQVQTQVGTRTAAQIQASLRQSTRTGVGVGIKRGK